VLMLSAFSSTPPLVWKWIASSDIIDVSHFGLPCPHSYHHIPYAFYVKVYRVLHIPLAQLIIDPFDIIAWHAFLLFHSWCLSFLW
jgi:hypothetical protein